jgi:PilZ domain-containing protein
MTQKQSEREQRLTFRVAVRPGAGIDAYLTFAGRKLIGRVRDVSAEGMFVALDRDQLAALKVDTMVDVEIWFEDEKIVLFGVIRSQHANGYGLFFPDRDPAGRANPLSRFGRISAQLQRASLSQRLKVLKLPD